jgi:hypothetical protein
MEVCRTVFPPPTQRGTAERPHWVRCHLYPSDSPQAVRAVMR